MVFTHSIRHTCMGVVKTPHNFVVHWLYKYRELLSVSAFTTDCTFLVSSCWFVYDS